MVILIIVHNSVNEEHQHLTRGLMVIQTSGMACTLHTTPPYVMIWVFLCASKWMQIHYTTFSPQSRQQSIAVPIREFGVSCSTKSALAQKIALTALSANVKGATGCWPSHRHTHTDTRPHTHTHTHARHTHTHTQTHIPEGKLLTKLSTHGRTQSGAKEAGDRK